MFQKGEQAQRDFLRSEAILAPSPDSRDQREDKAREAARGGAQGGAQGGARVTSEQLGH